VTRTPLPGIRDEARSPAPPGTSFHHLAGDEPSFLRVPVAIVVCVLGVGAISQIPGHDILAVHTTSDGDPALPMFGAVTPVVSWYVETALALPVLLAVILVISRRHLDTIVSVTRRVRWAWLGVCTLAACAALAVGGAGTRLLHPAADTTAVAGMPTTGTILATAALIALAGLHAVTLELLFRGWFLQALGAGQPAWEAILLQAFTFTAVHMPDLTVWGYTDLAVYGVAAGWLAISTGGIEAAIALPIVWNGGLTAVVFLTTGDPDPIRGMIAADWHTLVVHLTAVITYAALTRYLAHHRRVSATVSGPTNAPTRHPDQEPAP
jgi:uncharacterized protein